jgi:rapamycin-insensitive companion of mTOR
LASYAVLAPDRLENSLSYGYFEMLGVLSKHREGIKWVTAALACSVQAAEGLTRNRLLEKFKFFNSFYHLSEQRSREDITRMAIECFDYSL